MKNSTAKKLKQVPERYLIIGVDYLGLLPCLCANQKPVAKARLTLPRLNNICLPDGAVASSNCGCGLSSANCFRGCTIVSILPGGVGTAVGRVATG